MSKPAGVVETLDSGLRMLRLPLEPATARMRSLRMRRVPDLERRATLPAVEMRASYHVTASPSLRKVAGMKLQPSTRGSNR